MTAGHSACWGACAALTVALVAPLAGCSEDDTPSAAVSKAASAAQSAVSEATAAAGRQLDEIKDGLDVKGAATVGTPDTKSGRAAVEVTVDNTTGSTKSFAVQVDFTDWDGNTLDAVVVTVSDVPAGKSGTGTARSNRKLAGEVKAEVARAIRY
ncbi:MULTISPECIES: hypothetical protein [unclassified Streptomyces]|uniref:hypothetical protein n=1 Tax=unclassified Streptomyces TaxID=2593676 RepID=UPI003247360B